MGVSGWREQWNYVFTDGPSLPGDRDRGANTHLGPAGELGLMLGARLGEHVRTGGYVRLGCAGQPHPFIDQVERACLVHLGAQLTLSQHAYDGFYVLGRFGGAFHEETGWSAGGGLGYAFHVKGAWHLGLGLETTYAKIDSREQGDHGYYEYSSRLLTGGLAMRVLYSGL